MGGGVYSAPKPIGPKLGVFIITILHCPLCDLSLHFPPPHWSGPSSFFWPVCLVFSPQARRAERWPAGGTPSSWSTKARNNYYFFRWYFSSRFRYLIKGKLIPHVLCKISYGICPQPGYEKHQKSAEQYIFGPNESDSYVFGLFKKISGIIKSTASHFHGQNPINFNSLKIQTKAVRDFDSISVEQKI